MNLKLALTFFWTVLFGNEPCYHLIHSKQPLTDKQRKDINAILEGRSHARRFPSKLRGDRGMMLVEQGR